MLIDERDELPPGVFARLRGSGGRTTEVDDSAGQRMPSGVELHRRRVGARDAVAGVIVLERLIRMREVVPTKPAHDLVCHLARFPHTVVASGNQQHRALNLLYGNLGITLCDLPGPGSPHR